MSKKNLAVAVSDYKTLDDLCAHYATSDDKTRKLIANSVFRYVVIQASLPPNMVVLRRTDRHIEMSCVLGDEACFTIDCRHNTISTTGTWDVIGRGKLIPALNKIAKWYHRESRRLLRERIRDAKNIVQWASIMNVK